MKSLKALLFVMFRLFCLVFAVKKVIQTQAKRNALKKNIIVFQRATSSIV
jgi:hypothetical protein